MLVKKHVRIDAALNKELELFARQQKITLSLLIRELVELGLRVKTYMENKSLLTQSNIKTDGVHLEMGASASIETLLLLGKVAKNIDEHWLVEANQEATKRIEFSGS